MAASANAVVGEITGSVTFTGNTYAIRGMTNNTVWLEKNLTEPLGTVLLRNPSDDTKLLTGTAKPPTGYHVSKTTTADGFHYCVKDNTVIYDGNGATTSDGKTRVADVGDTATVTIKDKAEVGFEMLEGLAFAGWNTEANGSGTSFQAGSTASVPSGGELVLYAQQEPGTYTVTFDSNATSGQPVTGTTPDVIPDAPTPLAPPEPEPVPEGA